MGTGGDPVKPGVGDEAPDFELTWRVGAPAIRRSEYQAGEPLVLFFFPLAFSPVCTDEMCALAPSGGAWDSLDARVLGVSVDSPWVNVRFAAETGATFPLLSDFNTDVARAYGVCNDDYFGMRGVADRAAFVVDGDGRVVWRWHTPDDAVLPPFDEIREVVAGLRG